MIISARNLHGYVQVVSQPATTPEGNMYLHSYGMVLGTQIWHPSIWWKSPHRFAERQGGSCPSYPLVIFDIAIKNGP